MNVKVKTFFMPNMNQSITVDGKTWDVGKCEQEIKKEIKKRLENGFTLLSAAGGDCFVTLIFVKDGDDEEE